MPNQHTDGPRRTVRAVVMLTDAEHALAVKLATLYRSTVSDVLRSGLGSFKREHDTGERETLAQRLASK